MSRIDAPRKRAGVPSATERAHEKLLVPPVEVADDSVDVTILAGEFGDCLREEAAAFRTCDERYHSLDVGAEADDDSIVAAKCLLGILEPRFAILAQRA